MQQHRQNAATASYQRSRQSSYVSSRLTQSVENQLNYDFIYNSWDTLSAGIADKIRSGSVRVERREKRPSHSPARRKERKSCYGMQRLPQQRMRLRPLCDPLNNNVYANPSCNDSHQFPPIEERDERYPLLTSMKEESITETETVKGTGISWISVAFGLANASIGVGLLNYPAIYSRIGGVESATAIQLVMLACLFLSMVIIIYCADIHGSCSYHEVLSSMCGPRAKVVVALDIALATYGICIAYLVTIGDQYDRIFASLVGIDFCKHWYLDRKFMMLLTGVSIFPICLLKKLDFLKHTGPLGIFAMLYVVFLSVYEHFKSEPLPRSPVQDDKSFTEILACVPVILFGYQCNEVIVPIYASLKERKLANFLKAAVATYSVLLLLYCTVGTFGYLSYGSSVAPNVMLMFNASDPLVMLGIVALIFKMAVTYPQMAFAGREAFSGVISEYSPMTLEEAAVAENSGRLLSSTVWFLSSLLIAAFAPNIGIVLQVLGVLAAINVFICPALCLLFLTRRKDHTYSASVKTLLVMLAGILIILGSGFTVLVASQVYADVKLTMKDGTNSLCIL